MMSLKKHRVVDLCKELQPGLLKVGDRYVHRHLVRRLDTRQFIYAPDNMLTDCVDTETHIGTNVEGPIALPG